MTKNILCFPTIRRVVDVSVSSVTRNIVLCWNRNKNDTLKYMDAVPIACSRVFFRTGLP